MSPNTSRKLLSIHRWCSVIVSLNFVFLALTGLILVFHDEIDGALGVVPEAGTGAEITVARAVSIATEANPGETVLYAYRLDDKAPGVVFVGFADGHDKMRTSKTVAVDVHGPGAILPKVDLEGSFTVKVLELHAEMFMGVPGRLLLGVIGLAILTTLITGFLVYGPTMRRFSFGMLRKRLSRRTLLADLHKLLGAATFGWNLVVAATGVLLCFSGLLLQLYAATELAERGQPFKDEPVVTEWSTLDDAIHNAESAAPNRRWTTVAMPGSALASPRHYGVLLRGDKGIEEHMIGVTLVDAIHPESVTPVPMSWYGKAALLSEPLHFGNYGGLPVKIVWTLFTVITLVLSVSGVWVFAMGRFGKKRATLSLETAAV